MGRKSFCTQVISIQSFETSSEAAYLEKKKKKKASKKHITPPPPPTPPENPLFLNSKLSKYTSCSNVKHCVKTESKSGRQTCRTPVWILILLGLKRNKAISSVFGKCSWWFWTLALYTGVWTLCCFQTTGRVSEKENMARSVNLYPLWSEYPC